MKIALLAPSGAGKTIYLTGLYGLLTRELSNSDYGIDFSISDRVKNSYLDTRYTKLVEDHDFGEGSKEMTVYPLKLTTQDKNNEKKDLNVEIVDFPGGFLHQASDENKAEVEKVIEILSGCDGFIVLLDGEGLIKGLEKRDPRVLQNKTRANAVQEVLARALERRRARNKEKLPDPDSYAFGKGPTPIVFALTKGDMVEAWLSVNPEEKQKKLQEGVGNQFTLHSKGKGAYAEQEGAISNFMRSQFGQIIDAPDVCSLRTVVTVYNETEEMMDPLNVDTVFQFVLFAGLRNAHREYERRNRSWSAEKRRREDHFDSEASAYKRAVSAKEEWARKGLWGKFNAWLEDEGEDYHVNKVTTYHADMRNAGSKADESKLSVKQIKENRNTIKLFYERILPAELIHRLAHYKGRESFYQQGFPLDSLANESWWVKKSEMGNRPGCQPWKPGTMMCHEVP